MKFVKWRKFKTMFLGHQEIIINSQFYIDFQSRGDSPSQHSLETKNVFDEDLQKKIEENERLHIQVSCCILLLSVIVL